MTDKERYSMRVGNIDQQEIDLLECLLRIDMHQSIDPRAVLMLERLVQSGLVDSSAGKLTLTLSGIERCQSLQHRVAGDKEAVKVLADRGIALAGSSHS